MTTWTPLDEFYGLLDLILLEADQGRNFTLDGVNCWISETDEGHGLFEAVHPAFGMAALFPGWAAGDHSAMPVHITILGDHLLFMRWLPISRTNKLTIADRLSLSQHTQTLLRMMI